MSEDDKGSTSLKDKMDFLEARFKELDSRVKPLKAPKPPRKYRSRRQYKKGKMMIVWFGSNHSLDFKWGEVFGGLVKVGEETYKAYEKGAVYFYKKFPACAVFEWRLTPVGGRSEVFRSRVIGGDSDKEVAEELGLSSFAQQTIIRSVKQEELAKDDKKKKKIPMAVLLIVGGILLFVLGKAFGVI